MISRRLLAVLLLAAAPAALAEAPGVYAITGGTVHPVSGASIPNGIVVIRGGLIEAVGANVAIPPDASTIDAAGGHVYPGLIDAHSSLGLPAPPRRRGGGPGAPPRTQERTQERTPEPTPDYLAVRHVNISDDDAGAWRGTGVLTIVTAPTQGIFNGQSVVLSLGTGDVASRVIRSPASLQISFNPRPTWTFPDSLMGVIAHLRQTFLDARQHAAAREIYERSPAGLPRPPENAALEALRPVIRRELPVVFVADSDEMIRRAQAIARELELRYIIAGAREAYQMAAELKDVPVLVSVKWPTRPSDAKDRAEQPLRVIRDRVLAPTTPAALAQGGVTFALVSGAGKAGDFLPGIRKAIANGLSADDALRATTLTPARIFGVDRQLGSLDRGKIANVVLTDKPIFEENAKVSRVFVDGREIRLPAEAPKPSAEPSAIDGTWAITVRAPQGEVSFQVTLRAEDGRLTGTYSGDRGSGEIRGGTFDGNAFDFTVSATAQNEAEMTDWVFSGTVSGDTMSGTVTTTLGNFEFTGSRSQ